MDLLEESSFVYLRLLSAEKLRLQEAHGSPKEIMGLSAEELRCDPEKLFTVLAQSDADNLRHWIENKEQEMRCDILSLQVEEAKKDILSMARRKTIQDESCVELLLLDMTGPYEQKILQSHLIRAESLHELTSALAHEINNPLTVALGFANLLTQEDLSPNLREIVEPMLLSLQRAAKLARSFYQLSQPGISHRQAVLMHDLFRSIVDLKREKLQSQGIELALHLPVEELIVEGDRAELERVFLHLIQNAEYVLEPTGGRIEIRAVVEGQRVQVSVGDNGPGIPTELHPKIFWPFFTTKPEGEGTGLGLAISKQVVESHGGTLTFTTELGRGTTFHIRLPLAEKRKRKAKAPATTKTDLPPLRLLVADDDYPVAESLQYILQRFGHDVTVANGGAEVIMRLKQAKYDVVISDWKMPGGGGKHVYEYLRREDPDTLRRLILMTGTQDAKGIEELSPPVRILYKPFTSQELLRNLVELVC